MERENLFVMTEPDWDQGIMLNFYNGTVSIIAAKQYEKDGETRTTPRFCKADMGYRKYSDTAVPMGPRMASEAQARQVLTAFVKHMGGEVTWKETKNDTKAPF